MGRENNNRQAVDVPGRSVFVVLVRDPLNRTLLEATKYLDSGIGDADMWW